MIRLILIFLAISTSIGMSADAQEGSGTGDIIERTILSIVAIRTETPTGVASGTGFIVDSSGVIVTNLHVIEGAMQVEIKLHSGEQYSQVKVAAYDEKRDLAVIRIPGFDLPILQLGNSDNVKAGTTVYAVGNPLGLEESVTKGIVSSVRVVNDGNKIIQTDTAVSPGNSGGPLIDEDGNVIGVVTFKIQGGENINFAMPINYVRALLGFETLMSLEELSREIGKSNVSLFEEEPESRNATTGTWLSLSTNTLRELTIDEEYIYGSFNFENESEGSIANGTFDLKRSDGNLYQGKGSARWNCWYYSFGSRKDNFCADDAEIELRLVAPDRIEGRAYGVSPSNLSDRENKKACKSCNENRPRSWQDFVWVRQE